MNEDLIIYYTIILLMLLPHWITYSKAGLKPYLSLTLLVPYWGVLISLAILAFIKWPMLEAEE